MKLEVAFGPGLRSLATATDGHLRNRLHATRVKIVTPIAKKIQWTPSFFYRDADGVDVAIEVSQVLYPTVLRMVYADLLRSALMLRVIVVAPQEVLGISLRNEDELGEEDLRAHGIGLWTVNKQGQVVERFRGIPIIQVISETEFDGSIDGLKKRTKERLRSAYDRYCQDTLSGLRDLTELAEASAKSIVQIAIVKGFAFSKAHQKSGIATKLDAIMASGLLGHNAEVSALRSYITKHRNTVHHSMETAQQEVRRLRTVRHGFLEGLGVVAGAENAFGPLIASK